MVFSSLLFIYLFLPLNLAVYLFFARDMRQKNITMLVFSLIFYAWGGPAYVLLLASMAGISWMGAILIQKNRKLSARKIWLFVTCGLMLLLLGIFKYTGFFLGTFHALFGIPAFVPEIALPIGISFYTFQLLSYVTDVYRREVQAQRRYWMLLLYASLFHQCIAGPIVRYSTIQKELTARNCSAATVAAGFTRFSIGLAKKAVFANTCGQLADQLAPLDSAGLMNTPALGLWLGAVAYMLEIYLDFSAYSDMAIGLGQMIGFHYMENFNYPYTAVSVTDFWRRWHISLSSFFRDYVYIPLGGSRCSVPRHIFNLLAVWFLTGLWHGASWNYVLWGLYYFLFLVIEKYILPRLHISAPPWLCRIGLLLIVLFGWVLFRFEDFSQLGAALTGMFGLNGNGFTSLAVNVTVQNHVFFFAAAALACTPFAKKLYGRLAAVYGKRKEQPVFLSILEIIVPLTLMLLATMALAGNSYNPFLYFQF